ncbi:MAG: VOC family protein [Gammaproteobacteria bacterium]|nr:VOC family protein [Gammaproteobacteria bacterium]
MIVGIHHVAIGVPDFQKGLEFYRDVLGFEVVSQGQISDNEAANRAVGLDDIRAEVAMLKAPNAYIELWQYSNPAPEDHRQRPSDYGYPHFALQVTDMQQEYERMRAAGMEFVGEPVDLGSSSAIYGKDPFGNVIEIYEIRDPNLPQLE